MLFIMEKVVARDNYFLQKRDACGVLGLSPHQKITTALRMLCYGVCADATYKYYRTSKSIAMKSLKRFCIAIRGEFEEHHLRQPTILDFEKQSTVTVDSQGCLHHLIACTMNRRISWSRGSAILETRMERNPSFWRL